MNFWKNILGFVPEKELNAIISKVKCHKCGSENVVRLSSGGGWTGKFKCNDCSYYTFVVYSDKMGGTLEDSIAIDKRDSDMEHYKNMKMENNNDEKKSSIVTFFEALVEHKEKETDEPVMIENWKRLAYLMYCNGGELRFHSFGNVAYGADLWKQGLTMEEGFDMLFFSGVITGISMYDPITFPEVYAPKMNAWIQEKIAEHEKNNPSGSKDSYTNFEDVPKSPDSPSPISDLKIVK